MKLNVTIRLDLTAGEAASYLAYAKQLGLHYGDPSNRELIERLIRKVALDLQDKVYEQHPPAMTAEPPPRKRAVLVYGRNDVMWALEDGGSWYWKTADFVSHLFVPTHDSRDEEKYYPTLDKAKAAAKAWFLEQLERASAR